MNLKMEIRPSLLQYLKVEKSNLRMQMILQNLLRVMRLRLAIIRRERQLNPIPRKVQPNLSSKLEKALKQKMAVYQWSTTLLGLRL